jgi:hypothetical protein
MNEQYAVALLANVARIKADLGAAADLQMLEADSRFPLNASLRRGRGVLLKNVDEQINRLVHEGGLPLLRWDA